MALTNTELAAQLQLTIDGWQQFVTEVTDWSTSTADTVSFTDPLGGPDIVVDTLYKITTDYANLTGAEWATTPEDVLVPSGNLVDEYSAYHWAKKAEAAAAGVASVAAEVAAAELARDEAEAAQLAAETAESGAVSARTAAETAETNAQGHATAAAGSATTAATEASNASTSAALAEDWASELEDVEVTTGKYSAYHWAQKAEEWAAGAAVGTFDALSDVDITGRTDGMVPYYDQTSDTLKFKSEAGALVSSVAGKTGAVTLVEADITDLGDYMPKITLSEELGHFPIMTGSGDLMGSGYSPADFADATHTHGISDVTNLQTELNSKEPAFTKNTAFNKNFGTTAGTVAEGDHTHAYAGTVHTHSISDVTGLQTALDGKAPTSHTHGTYDRAVAALTGAAVISDIDITDGIVTNVATRNLTPGDIGAATSSHTHGTYDRASSSLSGATVFSNIAVTDGIVTTIGTRNLTAANVGAAAASHTHAIGDVTGLQTALDGKASTSHTHSTYDRASSVLSGASVFSNIVVTDGIVTSIATRNLTAANVGAAAAVHTHAIADVTGLQAALDSKGTGDITAVTAGFGLSGGGTTGSVTLAVDTDEFTEITNSTTLVGTDELLVRDATTEKRINFSLVKLSLFNNDLSLSSFTNNLDLGDFPNTPGFISSIPTTITATTGFYGGATTRVGYGSNDCMLSDGTNFKWFNDSVEKMRLEGNGYLHLDSGWTAYSTTIGSDRRLKSDITPLGFDSLEAIKQLNGYTFTLDRTGERKAGLIAQELQAVLPEATPMIPSMKDGEEYLGVDPMAVIAMLVESVKTLESRIAELEGR